MARTHSSYTASPTRLRSPHHSPTRAHSQGRSQDGSQYEMDLDALGLNSTFESTELERSHAPPVDCVDTSDIEGPADFTMNMTYWMTADLGPAQIKSRKEANTKRSEARMDATNQADQTRVEEGTQHKVNGDNDKWATRRKDVSPPISPSVPTRSSANVRAHSTPASERSMENDEKVRSFLSALPDTDMDGALTGTPMHVPRLSFLQVPRSSPPKARSLQPTVEDYDTPRKPTQETVIRHTPAIIDTSEQDIPSDQILGLQSQLEQQEVASKTRITELETILLYTRTELDGARTDNYRLHSNIQQQSTEHETASTLAEAQMQAREDALGVKMKDLDEELRLQNNIRLQKQREQFEQQMEAQDQSSRAIAADVALKERIIEELRQELQNSRDTQPQTQGSLGPVMKGVGEQLPLSEQLNLVQARANDLQSSLEIATAEARAAREDGQKKDATRLAVERKSRAYISRISALEIDLQTARFDIECAQADAAAKRQLFLTNLGLNTRLRTLQSEFETLQASHAMQQNDNATSLDTRMAPLLFKLEHARADLVAKDQEITRQLELQEQNEQRYNTARGRIEGLEASLAMVRQQLAEAHRESAKAKADAEHFELALQDSNDRLQSSRTEADRRVLDVEKRLAKLKETRVTADDKLMDLQSQHDDMIEGHEAMVVDVRRKAEDAVRKASLLLEQERSEKRRMIQDLKKVGEEVEQLRTAAQRQAETGLGDESRSMASHTSDMDGTETELTELRNIIRRQVAEMKTLSSGLAGLKKENRRLNLVADESSNLQAAVTLLESNLAALRSENSSLQARLVSQEKDFEAINTAMDQKLAGMLSKVMKDRAKTVVGKRDQQWAQTVNQVQTEKELISKVLLRQWGREEVGIADEQRGEQQGYAYKYIQR